MSTLTSSFPSSILLMAAGISTRAGKMAVLLAWLPINFNGEIVWTAVDAGHMHKGWIANIGENRRRVAMAMRLAIGASGSMLHKSTPTLFYFDAVTGEPIDFNLPVPGCNLMPVDFIRGRLP